MRGALLGVGLLGIGLGRSRVGGLCANNVVDDHLRAGLLAAGAHRDSNLGLVRPLRVAEVSDLGIDDGGGAHSFAGGKPIHDGDGEAAGDNGAVGAGGGLVAHREGAGAGAARAAEDEDLTAAAEAVDEAEGEGAAALTLHDGVVVDGGIVVVRRGAHRRLRLVA